MTIVGPEDRRAVGTEYGLAGHVVKSIDDHPDADGLSNARLCERLSQEQEAVKASRLSHFQRIGGDGLVAFRDTDHRCRTRRGNVRDCPELGPQPIVVLTAVNPDREVAVVETTEFLPRNHHRDVDAILLQPSRHRRSDPGVVSE